MKHKLSAAFIAALLFLPGRPGWAADTRNVSTELSALVMKVNNQLKTGKDTEKDLAAELDEFDALFAKHKNEKTDEVAHILLAKATLYLQVLDNAGKGQALIKQVKSDFPGTRSARDADRILESMKEAEDAKKINASLVEGSTFPDFSERDLSGKPLSIANYKGKVVLIDFWATWCGPCVAELPNVLKTYAKFHTQGLEIIGVSLDEDQQKLESFIKQKNLTWQQFFDGKGWQNKLAAKYGISSIPATYLLDGAGKIIGKDLRGEHLENAVAKALAKK